METGKKRSCAIQSQCLCVCVVVMIPLKMILDCCDVTSGSLMIGGRGGGSVGAIKRPGCPSSAAWIAFLFCQCVTLCVRLCVCVCVCARLCKCMCTGADDRGHGLRTRGTANEKEAFPLTFHGSQKQFAQ